ncbi:MAG: hypothetical protein OXE99_12215 [Cellvibrionales bacterium]|nr:hypothetical protein [Cellvibrionales bacterium]
MKKIIKYLFIFSSFIFSCSSFSGLKITPAYINAKADGKKNTLEVPIRIVNTSMDKIEYLDMTVASSAKDADENWNYDMPPNEKNSLASWVLLSEKSIVVKPKQEKVVMAKIQIKTKKPGDYRGSIFISQNKEKTIEVLQKRKKNKSMETSTTMYAISRVAIPVTLRLSDPKKSMPSLNQFVKLGQSEASFDHVAGSLLNVSALVDNKANFAVENTGRCELLSKSGELLFTQPIHKVETFANEKTKVRCIFNDYIPANQYQLAISVNSNIKGKGGAIPLEQKSQFQVTKADEVKIANSMLSRDDDKLLTPLKIEPEYLSIVPDSDSKKKWLDSKVTVRNLTGKNMLVRPFFLQMPSKKISKNIKFLPKKFSLKPYASKEVTVKVKNGKKDVFGKLIFSAKKHKSKMPASANFAMQKEAQGKPSFAYADKPRINVLGDGKVQLFVRFKNDSPNYLDKLQAHVELLHTETNKLIKQTANRSKASLIPGEKSSAYFFVDSLKEGLYEVVVTVQQANSNVPLNTQYLKVSQVDGKIHYAFIEPEKK